jgi:ribonuclease HI
MPDYREVPLPYGVKLVFDDGTVVNWFREGKRRTVYAEKNPFGYRFPRAAGAIDEILAAIESPVDASALMVDDDGVPLGAFDGGSDPNPGVGGWGIVLADGRELCGGEPHTTNNRMELTGAIRLLEETSGPLRAIGDSRYVIEGITHWIHAWRRREWKTVGGQPVENRDLWERLGELAHGRSVRWERVKGHHGHLLNERCDQLVALGRKQVRASASAAKPKRAPAAKPARAPRGTRTTPRARPRSG